MIDWKMQKVIRGKSACCFYTKTLTLVYRQGIKSDFESIMSIVHARTHTHTPNIPCRGKEKSPLGEITYTK